MQRKPFTFFGLVLLLSIPFWMVGFFAKDFAQKNPMQLPLSALMTFCPLIAAAILTNKKNRTFAALVKHIFDCHKIDNKQWYLPILLLIPIIALISYGLNCVGPVSTAHYSFISILIFFALYFIGAIGEEIGWSAYTAVPLQHKYGALQASVIIGAVWAIWHWVPYFQMGKTTNWIVLKSISTILLRIIMFWIFNNTNKSVFAMILFHTMINLSPYLFGRIDFEATSLAVSLFFCALLIVVLWNSNFTKLRFKKPNRHIGD